MCIATIFLYWPLLTFSSLSWRPKVPGTPSMCVLTPLWPVVLESRQPSGSLYDRSPGRHSFLETSTTCVPAAPRSRPAPCLHPRARQPPTRPTRRRWRGKHTSTARPSAQCCCLCAARYWFCSGVSYCSRWLIDQWSDQWESPLLPPPTMSQTKQVWLVMITYRSLNQDFRQIIKYYGSLFIYSYMDKECYLIDNNWADQRTKRTL